MALEQTRLWLNGDRQCYYCRICLTLDIATRDHVVPRVKGGVGLERNVVLACRPCNAFKANMDEDTFRESVWFRRRLLEVVKMAERVVPKGVDPVWGLHRMSRRDCRELVVGERFDGLD